MNQQFRTGLYNALYAAYRLQVICTGVTLQKVPERTFDRTATNLVVTLLATTITEQ